MQRILLVVIGLLLAGTIVADGNSSQLMMRPATSETIFGLEKAISDAQAKAPVLFPSIIPARRGEKYYASVDYPNIDNIVYIINIGLDEKCRGQSVCNVGFLQAQVNGKLEQNGKSIGEELKLQNGDVAYFIPGYVNRPLFLPASIVWRSKNVLYTLTWKLSISEEKAILLKMANSVMKK